MNTSGTAKAAPDQRVLRCAALLTAVLLWLPRTATAQTPEPAPQRLTLDDAVRRGLETSHRIAEAVARGECDRGIVLGGSGNGEAIVANKVHGIRCALCWNVETARLAREHNDSNVLSLGQRMIPDELALEIVRVWLATPFAGGRHARRIALIE